MNRKALGVVVGLAGILTIGMVAGSLLSHGQTAEAGYYVLKCGFNWALGAYRCVWVYVNTCVTGGECP